MHSVRTHGSALAGRVAFVVHAPRMPAPSGLGGRMGSRFSHVCERLDVDGGGGLRRCSSHMDMRGQQRSRGAAGMG